MTKVSFSYHFTGSITKSFFFLSSYAFNDQHVIFLSSYGLVDLGEVLVLLISMVKQCGRINCNIDENMCGKWLLYDQVSHNMFSKGVVNQYTYLILKHQMFFLRIETVSISILQVSAMYKCTVWYGTRPALWYLHFFVKPKLIFLWAILNKWMLSVIQWFKIFQLHVRLWPFQAAT